jgi:hypothetical protein
MKEVYFLVAFTIIWFLVFLKYFAMDHISTIDFKQFHVRAIKERPANSLRIITEKSSISKFENFEIQSEQLSTMPSKFRTDVDTHPFKKVHTIFYGIIMKHPHRTPSIMIRSEIGPSLLDRFQQLPMFSCPEPELENFGMNQAVDYPKRKQHIYHEGYYHTQFHSKPIFSRNPRSGVDFMKPAAGEFLNSFYEAMRKVNKKIFDELGAQLWQSARSRSPEAPEQDICGQLSRWVSDGFHFSDLSIQIHYGTAINDEQLFWHSDAENSLIHLGLTIRGRRVLHSRRAERPDSLAAEVAEEQRPGSLYLSTSTLMNHAPEYPEVTSLSVLPHQLPSWFDVSLL